MKMSKIKKLKTFVGLVLLAVGLVLFGFEIYKFGSLIFGIGSGMILHTWFGWM